ncbi:MAG TPA: FHA domain-containing serine/threonine-protein kinase, partial [Planctomycetota bacterium]|nr:FHA domain-containing serine/threonine-protein kinase [Planctomycetota bacterium]
RFEREIEAMERFVHPDAVMIRDSGVTERGTPYYTMDFIEGESLKVVLRREKRIVVDRALAVVRRILRVLDVAHANQIIHRDIKPDNILVTTVSGRETVKVLDFGVAKLLDMVGETGSVTRGGRVGTPKYMSPEQILGEPLDVRSDLFSLGIVFYELVTGEHPFARVNDPIRVTAAILNREPRPPSQIVPDLPRPVEDHIRWMLQKSPDRRPASAAVLIQQLGALEGGVSRVAPIESLVLRTEIDRAAAVPLVLRWETSAGERRAFLVFDDLVRFGRTSDPERGIENDLLLRCLPCRSKSRDPVHWQQNLTISQQQGTIRPDGTTVLIEPAPQSRSGIRIGGVRCTSPIPIHTDRFHIALGDRVLELDGHRRLRGPAEPYWELDFLRADRPSAAMPRESVGYSSETCLIDHVRLARANNWPLHDYYLVWRQLEIGSSANAGLRLPGTGVEAVHASLIHDGGEIFLVALGGRVGVSGGPLGAVEIELHTHEIVPLRPGLVLRFGETVVVVDRAEKKYFKDI